MRLKWNIWTILITAFVVRLIGLNQSFWLDETTTARVVERFSSTEIWTVFSPFDFHPPFYYLFINFWSSLFGYSEIALRIPSVIASILTGLVVYKIGLELKLKNAVALWAAAFFLFNPLIIYYSQEARMYALATLFLSRVVLSVIRILPTKKVSFIENIFANTFIFLSLGTFYGSVFLISALYMYFIFNRKWKKLLLLLPGTLLAVAVIFPLFTTQLKHSGEVLRVIPNWSSTLGTASLKNLILVPIKFTSGKISMDPKVIFYSIAGLWSLVVAYFALKSFRDKKIRLMNALFLLPVVLGFVISFYKPLLQYFRFQYVIPYMAVLLAVGAVKKWQNYLLLGGFVIFSFTYLLFPMNHREDWKSLVAQLPSTKVYALPSSFDPLLYYNPKLLTVDLRENMIQDKQIVVVPYVADIYGLNYAEKLRSLGYRKNRDVNVRELSFEVWNK